MRQYLHFHYSSEQINNSESLNEKLFDALDCNITSNGLIGDKYYFKGTLNNKVELARTLKCDLENETLLLELAFKKWGPNVNQHMIGDYVFLWREQNRITVTSSIRSSYTLFWREAEGLSIVSELSELVIEQPEINPRAILQKFAFGINLSNRTNYEDISKLLPGETIVWRLENAVEKCYQERMSHDLQNELSLLVRIEQSRESVISPVRPIDKSDLYRNLPVVSRVLSEPVADASQVHFYAYVKELANDCARDGKNIELDKRWLEGRYCLDIFEKAEKIRFKKLLGRKLAKEIAQFDKEKERFIKEFELTRCGSFEKMSFQQWFDLNYLLPSWCQSLQTIASANGITLINPYQRADVAKNLVTDEAAACGYFGLFDASAWNIFEATQRLYYNGESETKEYFKITPPNSASLVKNHRKFPRRIEQSCIQLLTFDYLKRFRTHRNTVPHSNSTTIKEA